MPPVAIPLSSADPHTDPSPSPISGTPVSGYPPITTYPVDSSDPSGWIADDGPPSHNQYAIDNGLSGNWPFACAALATVDGGYCFINPASSGQLLGLNSYFGISSSVAVYKNQVTVHVRLKASVATTAQVDISNSASISRLSTVSVTTSYQEFTFTVPTIDPPYTGNLSTIYCNVVPTEVGKTLYYDAVWITVDETPPLSVMPLMLKPRRIPAFKKSHGR